MVNQPKELDTQGCSDVCKALTKGVKSPRVYRNGEVKGGGGGRRVKVEGVFTLGPSPGTLAREGRQVIPHDDAGKALLKQEAIESIGDIAARNGGAVVKETVVQSLMETFYLFEVTKECLGDIVDAAIEDWKESRRHQAAAPAAIANGGPGQALVPGQQPPGQVFHPILFSPAAAAAAAAAAADPAPLVHPGQAVPTGNNGLVTHDQVNTAFGAVNLMFEKFGEGQAKRDAGYEKDRADDRKERAKEREQTQQIIDRILGRTEGLEEEVEKQGGQISDIKVRQGKMDRRLKKQGGHISTLHVNQGNMRVKVGNLEEGYRAHSGQIGNLQNDWMQQDAQLGDQNHRLTILEQYAQLSPGGPLVFEAATKAAGAAAAAAAAAAKRKPPSTPTGTAADGNGGGDFSPTSSSSSSSPSSFFFADDANSDLKPPHAPVAGIAAGGNSGGDVSPSSSTSSSLDRKPSPEPSPDNARGSGTTAADSDIFFVRPIRRDGLSQDDEDEVDEGMKELEAIRKSLEKTLRGAGYDV